MARKGGKSVTRFGMLLSDPLALPVLIAGAGLAAASGAPPTFELGADALLVRAEGRTLSISLRSPALMIGELALVGNAAPSATTGAVASGQPLEVSYPHIRGKDSGALEVRLFVQWSQAESVVRKWARFRLTGVAEGIILREVILDRIDAQGRPFWTHGAVASPTRRPVIREGPQSRPVFMPGLFLGVEYPVAATRCEDGRIVLAHRPGLRMQPGVWHQTRTAVYGLTPVGQEARAFGQYIAAHRPEPKGFHVNYNSWWTSPVPYSEQDILGLMKVFEEKLFKAHGVAMDTFAIDLGWSDPRSLWEIEAKRFPAGFARIRDAAQGMRSSLGLWISPSSYYPPGLDSDWAKAQGYEAFSVPTAGGKGATIRLLCLGGRRYAEGFRQRLADLAGRWGIRHLKLDGCSLECPESDHGHEPGALSSEAIAEGVIAAAQAARKADPQVWIETTCFGYNPSPWWLFHVNSVIGTFGDDAPAGRIPAPVYRESYTSARDYFNLQGAALLPVPAAAQEVLGIVHQSADPFMNDAVMTVMRGHMFLPLYVNPKFMSEARWQSLAGLLKWARASTEVLGSTVPLLPSSWQAGDIPRFSDEGVMPREPYGYAHVSGDAGLVGLRSPWIAPQSYRLKLDGALGVSPGVRGLSAVSLYPEPRVYGEGLCCGDALVVPLAPYETVVLSIKAGQPVKGLPRATAAGSWLRVGKCESRIERVAFQDSRAALGPDWTSPLGDAAGALRMGLKAEVRVKAPQAELLVLCEGEKSPVAPVGPLRVNGREAATSVSFSDAGWSATMLPRREHWTFLRAPLGTGENRISLDGFAGDDCRTISAWVWATKPGTASAYPNALPHPELVSLDGALLIAPLSVAKLPAAALRVDRPVERIDGVFLDALEPVSVKQGYGTLQRNRSVWEKPMLIGGRRFVRGLGTHAPAKIVFALEGKYRRFQSWAGPDGNTAPTVTFEVWVDGARRWQSGLMTRESDAVWVDLDIAGAKTLELVVGEAGDFTADHADWAEARLLR